MLALRGRTNSLTIACLILCLMSFSFPIFLRNISFYFMSSLWDEISSKRHTGSKSKAIGIFPSFHFIDAFVLSSLPLMLTCACIISRLSAAGGKQHVSLHVPILILLREDRNKTNPIDSSAFIYLLVTGPFDVLCGPRSDLEKTNTWAGLAKN